MSSHAIQKRVRYKRHPEWTRYLVGTDGSVWSRGRWNGRWKKLTLIVDRDGYHRVNLYDGGGGQDRYYGMRQFIVHRLVLETFFGPCPEGMEARHKDGNPANNAVGNLAWGTSAQNQQDRIVHGTMPRGENHRSAKLTESDVRAIRELSVSGCGPTMLAKRFGVCVSAIHRAKTGKSWRHLDGQDNC